MIRVAVLGALGRMGSAVCEAVDEDPDLELAGAVNPEANGAVVNGVAVSEDLQSLKDIDVVVDFTDAAAAEKNSEWSADNDVHAVVGTTGIPDDAIERFRQRFSQSQANCIIAPNFAIGALVMMRCAELAAPWFEGVEVIELHHDRKVDAPSGTALKTAERVAAASSEWNPDPTRKEVITGARGGEAGGIHVHSVRLPGLVAHQEVIFGTRGQTLTIRHDTTDRVAFMPGVLMAIKAVAQTPGLTVGLEKVLGL